MRLTRPGLRVINRGSRPYKSENRILRCANRALWDSRASWGYKSSRSLTTGTGSFIVFLDGILETSSNGDIGLCQGPLSSCSCPSSSRYPNTEWNLPQKETGVPGAFIANWHGLRKDNEVKAICRRDPGNKTRSRYCSFVQRYLIYKFNTLVNLGKSTKPLRHSISWWSALLGRNVLFREYREYQKLEI